ncbi:hypothetical protein GMI70_10100 [Eggerthellaceae bacterium zg-893]|nr:hypothetical protein [Eggerthellaceae bacterium zg-893]
MNACETNMGTFEDTFDAILSAWQKDKYWISFFVRPCCPPPSEEVALGYLEKLRAEIRSNAVFSDDEKQQLLEIVDDRETWYKNSPFCRP